MMEAFFDDVVARLYDSRKETFDQVNPTFQESHDAMIKKRQELVSEYGQGILESIAPNIRTKTSGGRITQMDFKKENIQFKLWDHEMQRNAIPPISFNELKEFRGNPADLSIIHFETKGQIFEVGVYAFEGDRFVCCLHNYDKDGKYKAIMPEIDNMKQIFKPATSTPSSITLDEPVFSSVKISTWAGKADKRLRVLPLTYDEYSKIPQTPILNHSNILIEDSSDWIDDQGESLIQYEKHNSILRNQKNDQLKNNLVSFISKKHPRQMAKMFVRTKVVPAFDSYRKIVKAFTDITIQCQNQGCNEVATGTDEILTKFGGEVKDGIPHPKENCKHCS